ncbi:unnamed protein product, partial [Laminaria digitata]
LEEIGRGGGGTVHKAIHVPSMRLVAVKMVEVHDDDKRRQILQELKTLHSMKTVPLMSPKTPANEYQRRRRESGRSGRDLYLPVVTFHDAYMNRERGRVCMVMEYMDGGTLQQFVTRREALSEPALAAVAHSVLRGLAEMHAKRKIHRDIKPSNILLDRQGRVKISDFGVVRQLNETGSFAQTFTGTVTYMSPERIKDSDHSYPSDVWSLGMVIAALALGRFPLSTNSTSTDHMFDLIQAITEDPVPALSPQSFSPELCDLVELMLRRDPGERPTAVKLLTHPFLQRHHDLDSVALANMVK